MKITISIPNEKMGDVASLAEAPVVLRDLLREALSEYTYARCDPTQRTEQSQIAAYVDRRYPAPGYSERFRADKVKDVLRRLRVVAALRMAVSELEFEV